MNVNRELKRTARRGAAFLTLVVLLLLVVVGATKVLVTSEVSSRRDATSRERAKTLLAAIDVARQAGIQSGDSIRLPIDPSRDHWVDVSIQQDVVTAVWRSGDRVQQKVVRRLGAVHISGEQD